MSYYDTLQDIVNMAKWLQGSHIPDSEIDQKINLMYLANASHALNMMVVTIAPEVWVGDPADPMRGDRPMAPGLPDKTERQS